MRPSGCDHRNSLPRRAGTGQNPRGKSFQPSPSKRDWLALLCDGLPADYTPGMPDDQRITPPALRERKGGPQPIACVTAYDHPFARIADAAGLDVILVGDSLGTVVQGRENTLHVTMEEMLYHTKMVSAAVRRALVVGDMPFLSYQCGVDEAVKNAGRFLKEAGAQAVKLEGGQGAAPVIAALSRVDIPVMAHVGLTPQSIHRMGGYKVQRGRDRILADARAVEHAGAFAVVLEGIPAELAAEATAVLAIPTIGIGAGVRCDGQILVLHDLLGLTEGRAPKFAKAYAQLGAAARAALEAYRDEVRARAFPDAEHAYAAEPAKPPHPSRPAPKRREGGRA